MPETAVDIARRRLALIERLNPALGALVAVQPDLVLEDAARVDALPDLERRPLARVPVAIKDNVDVAGYPTRHGSAATSTEPARQDDELVRRLREAGAFVVGKSKLPELAIWPFTEPQAFGPARNPWDRSRTPGGSTGGGAAAVASGMARLALGSDGGGSIRIPAACCGIFGIKPAPGLVPLPGGVESHWLGLSAHGPLAPSVTEAAAMLDVLAGRDPEPLERPEGSLRVAVSLKHPLPGGRVSDEVRRAVRDTVLILGAEGHRVTVADPPYPPDIGPRFIRRWLAGIAEDARGLDPSRLETRTRAMARAGAAIARRGWATAVERDSFQTAMAGFFGRWDLLLMPTLTSTAVPIGKWRGGWIRTSLSVANWILTPAWNLAGVAAASLPAGLGEDGLPLGVQLVAAPGRERLLLEVAARIEARRPFPTLAAE
ncbi:MAG TPA: amidase family protein [Candidatus Dormibacteraeota bacterium]